MYLYDEHNVDEWYCENHPEFNQSHKGCSGAGIPANARIHMLLHRRKLAEQKYTELKWQYDHAISGLMNRINELEK